MVDTDTDDINHNMMVRYAKPPAESYQVWQRLKGRWYLCGTFRARIYAEKARSELTTEPTSEFIIQKVVAIDAA